MAKSARGSVKKYSINKYDTEDEIKPTLGQRAIKLAKRRFPISQWLTKYERKDLIADFISGVTVGLTVVPQSLGYAAIAGQDPVYGLYSSYIGCILYVFMGSCRQAAIGPTAVMGLLTFQTCGQDNPSCAVLTAFYSGVFELLIALLQLGWVVSFISESVTIGFTAGAATTIISSQVKSFLGIGGPKGSGFTGIWKAIINDFTTIHAGDAVMGISSFVALLLLRKLKDVKISPKRKALKTIVWLVSLSRNVIIIVTTSLIAFCWQTPPFKLVGHVQGGFPPVRPPYFELPKPSDYLHTNSNSSLIGNSTDGNFTAEDEQEYYSFGESWSVLGSGPLIIAIIAILQNVAISKAFGSGQKVDAQQEMLALGIINVVGGFFNCIPNSGSFSRSAVNEASGVRSPLGGLFTGILVLFSLGLLTKSFYWIPKSSLAAVIICAVMFMIEYESLLPMWRISKIDAITCVVTFVCSIFLGMEYGIIIGVAISIAAILLKTLHPKVEATLKIDDDTGLQFLLIEPATGLYFPSVDHVNTRIQKLVLKYNSTRVFVLSFAKWTNYDYTAANTLMFLVKGMKKNGKIVVFVDCHEQWFCALKNAGLSDPPCSETRNLSAYLNKHACLPLETLTGVSTTNISCNGSNGSTTTIETSLGNLSMSVPSTKIVT